MPYFYRAAAMFVAMCFSVSVQAASVWFADDQYAYQVDTSTNSITRSILMDKAHDLVVDASNSSLWAATGQQLSKFDSSGNPLFQIALKPLDLIQPRHLVADPYDGSLWLTDQNTLVHLNNQGQSLGAWPTSALIRDIALSLDQSLWLLGNKQLSHYSAQGALLATHDLQALVQEEPKFLAVNSMDNRLWVAGEKQILQFDPSNLASPLLNISLPAVATGITLDPNNGLLWVTAGEYLFAYARDGTWIKTVNLSVLAIQSPQRLVYDPVSKSLWLGHKTGVSRLTTEGVLLITLPIGKSVQAIGTSSFKVTPTLTLNQPPHDALINNPKPTFTLGYDAVCSGQPCGFLPNTSPSSAYFSKFSLDLLLNNHSVGNLFVFDPVTNQASFVPEDRLPEGINPFVAQATDSFGHLSNKIETIFTIDTLPPVITLTAPAAGLLTKQPQQTLTGNLSEQATLLINSQIINVTPDYHFNYSLTLAEGTNTLELTAIDTAGNSTQLTRIVTLDTIAPATPSPTLINIDIPINGQATITAMSGATEAMSVTTITNLASNETVAASAGADGAFIAQIGATSGDELTFVATDQAGNQSAFTKITVPGSGGGGDGAIPPDPATVAPPVDQTVASNIAVTTAFLYSGSNPIQRDVAPGTIELKRAAVLRGKVLTRDNQPLSGVRITIHGHPEFGNTLSRADGVFDMAVNGGGVLTISYEKPGFLPVQRQVNAPWQDFAWADDVVMISLDPRVTTVDLSSTVIQVARGTATDDSDGSRQATLLFTPGTIASMVLADGTMQALTTLNVRATEYTVGDNGPKAMPGALPPTSGYTYAVELSADEAIAAGAKQINFSQSVPVYVENFLNFPVGGIVPAGYYDRDRAVWIPAPNGLVIKIVAVNSGLADLDTDGDGLADSEDQLATLNISNAERRQLAMLYPDGISLWRVPTNHFTPFDYNWPYGPPPGAKPPKQPLPKVDEKEDKPECQGGSIIECQNQTLGERIIVTGAPFTLNYRSDRMLGRQTANSVTIPLSGSNVPDILKRIELEISVAGRQFRIAFPATSNQNYVFTWDGKDGYGRALQGTYSVGYDIGYVYQAVYQEPAQLVKSFAALSGVPITGLGYGETENFLWQSSGARIEAKTDVRGQDFGGWTASIHHHYDPNGRVLTMGDGTRRSATGVDRIITTVAGNSTSTFSGDGGVATAASLYRPYSAAIDSQGNLFIADTYHHRIRKVSVDGIITTVAGNGNSGFRGDGGAAINARLNYPADVAVDSQGNLFIADFANNRIRKVSPDGIITTVAGINMPGFSGDGVVATNAHIWQPSSVLSDFQGNLFFADTYNNRIRKVGVDGIITTVAGNGACSSIASGDGGAATAANLCFPTGITLDSQGNLFTASSNRIRKVGTDGIITTVAGNDMPGFSGDGGAATAASLNYPVGIAIDSQGNLFIADRGNYRIRKVDTDGIISTVAGNGSGNISEGNGGAAVAAGLHPMDVIVDAQGSLIIADWANNLVRKVESPVPSFTGNNMLVPSSNGAELYNFDPAGRHLRTLNAKTGAILYSFTYDNAGYLISVADGDNNTTLIERDTTGKPTAIVSADQQRTTLTLDSNGYLSAVSNPAGETYHMTYGTDGLLMRFTDPKSNSSDMSYDSLGRLSRDQNAAGGYWALNRIDLANGYEVSMTSAENRTTTYRVENLSTGNKLRTNLYPDGTKTVSLNLTNGATMDTAPDGTVTTSVKGPDPRLGMQAPIIQSLNIQTPSGLTATSITTRSMILTKPSDLFSLVSETTRETVNGKTTTTIYDAALGQYTLTSPLNRSKVVKSDTLGRVLQEQYASLEPVNYLYDPRGRLSSITHGTVGSATARTASLDYNAQGQLASVTDPLGRTVSYQYDLAGRATQQTLPDGRVVGYSYDANGNVTGITPPGRPSHTFSYNLVNLESQYMPPAAGLPTPQTQYAYNLDKDLTTITRPDGQLIEFAYDGGGRLAGLTAPSGTTTYGYAATTGNLQTISAPGNVGLSYSYDGSLLLNETWSGPISGSVGRTYNTDFRPNTVSVNGSALPYSYDNDGLLTQAGNLTLSRDPATGFIIATTLGQVTTSQSNTPFGELQTLAAAVNGTAVFSNDFVYDSASRIVEKLEIIQGQSDRYAYSYDPAGRLIQVSKNGTPISDYSYDDNGNRLSWGGYTGSYDEQDRLLQYGIATYAYTANGELMSKTEAGQTTTYGYDVFGNLRTATLPDSTTIEYLIDGKNRRIGKKVNGILAQGFLYQDTLKPIAELDGNNAITARFVYGTKTNVPEYMQKGADTYRIITDHLGSVRLVINTATGAIAQRMDYDEFGKVTLDSNPGFQPFGFAGGIYDQHTRLTRFGARDYDAQTGRWTAKDPIRFKGGDANLMAYVGNDPVNFVDPLGLTYVAARVYFSNTFLVIHLSDSGPPAAQFEGVYEIKNAPCTFLCFFPDYEWERKAPPGTCGV